MSTDSIASDVGPVERWAKPGRLSKGELADCRGARRDEHVAARVLTKSLVVRALELDEISKHCSEIECRKDEKGRPFLELSGEVRKASHAADWKEILVSWSHTDDTVAAVLWATTARDQRPEVDVDAGSLL